MQTPDALIRFDRLRERLVRGGVARRHVKRTVAELHDHYDDALDDGLTQGLIRDGAAEAAWQRLGSEDEIVATVLARPELRSLPARYPRVISAAGPILLWATVSIASGFLLVGTASALHSIGVFGPPLISAEPMWLQNVMNAVLFAYMCVLPIVIGASIAAIFARRALVPAWTLAGTVAISLLGAFTEYAITFPKIIGESGSLSIGFGTKAEELPVTLLVAAANGVLILAAYWYAQRWRRLK